MDVNKIYLGDNLETLKTFPDCSIDCCVTSPPYFGLRDYGTGSWVGGDPNCDHSAAEIVHGYTKKTNGKQKSNVGAGMKTYRNVCPTCGAVREDKQVGLEQSPEIYVERLVSIFHEVKRALKDDGTLWLNIGDSYSGGGNSQCKTKDLIGIPWMLAFALRADGWYLRQDIIWAKPNPMPESVLDRCTRSHEYVFMLSKNSTYYFDADAIKEKCADSSEERYKYAFNTGKEQENFRPNGASNTAGMKTFTGFRNKRDVWMVKPSSFSGAHFATFPEELIYPMIVAGCPKGGVVLDPFMGSGTVGIVAKKNNRNYVGCELNPEYAAMAEQRIRTTARKLF